jgi:hypothetical protein
VGQLAPSSSDNFVPSDRSARRRCRGQAARRYGRRPGTGQVARSSLSYTSYGLPADSPADRVQPLSAQGGLVIPAVITVIGVGFTGCVTLVGLLFKRSVDNRTVAISERNEQTRFAEQRRLQMDAANRAVQLLSLPDGSPAPTVQSSSAILVLAELGETEFAFT